jgi:hypothetical protein
MKKKLSLLLSFIGAVFWNAQAQTELDGYYKGGIYSSMSLISPNKSFISKKGNKIYQPQLKVIL